MQESFNISSSKGSYAVLIGDYLLRETLIKYEKSIFIIDQRLEIFLPESIRNRIAIEANEANKSLEIIPEIILKMSAIGANRSSHIVAIGGGVVQDIATFVASIFMRGITWSYMPTTMLGMVDSCIGGKSSINNMGYKNLVGNFYPPKEVLIDTCFIESLSPEQIAGGLCEAAKISYARGYSYFHQYLDESPSVRMDSTDAKKVINKVLMTKKWFIEIDEFDQKERLLLNFGHTFGHALEAGTNFAITHGVAVGIGMVIAVEYAKQSGFLNHFGLESAAHLISHVKTLFGGDLAMIVPLPPVIDLNAIVEKFNNDKKHKTDFYRMIVPKDDGQLVLIEESKGSVTHKKIKSAYTSGLKLIGYPENLIANED